MPDNSFYAVVHDDKHKVFELVELPRTAQRKHRHVFEQQDSTPSNLLNDYVAAAWVHIGQDLFTLNVLEYNLEAIAYSFNGLHLESQERYLLQIVLPFFKLRDRHKFLLFIALSFWSLGQTLLVSLFAQGLTPELLSLFVVVSPDDLHLCQGFSLLVMILGLSCINAFPHGLLHRHLLFSLVLD